MNYLFLNGSFRDVITQNESEDNRIHSCRRRLPCCCCHRHRSKHADLLHPSSSSSGVEKLGQINPDGTGDRAIATGLPLPFDPAWSRDGRFLTLTSVNPQRPNKVSQDVFIFDLIASTSRLALLFEDEVKIPPFRERTAHYRPEQTRIRVPIYKALSPDGARIAVSSLVTAGFYQGGAPDVKRLNGISQVARSCRFIGWRTGFRRTWSCWARYEPSDLSALRCALSGINQSLRALTATWTHPQTGRSCRANRLHCSCWKFYRTPP